MDLTPQELSKGILVVCDGGAYNNQSPDRIGYGSFRVFRDGNLEVSTYQDDKTHTHYFEYGVGVTNNVAECMTMEHALNYIAELVERGYKGKVRLGCDSQTALLGATTHVKKPAMHLRELYVRLHNQAVKLKDHVQFVKLDELDVKRVLGH